MNNKLPLDELHCLVCDKLIPKSQMCCRGCGEKGYTETITNGVNNVVEVRTNKPIPKKVQQ